MNLAPIVELLKNTYSVKEYPALEAQRVQWQETQPLAGLHVLDATPVYRNTLLKYCALLAAGAHLTVGISSVMSYDPNIVQLLQKCGIPVCSADDCKKELSFDLILDCAGSFSFLTPRIGYVELTRSGADSYSRNQRPVFFADGGKIKRIETCLGTGESYFRTMKQLGYDDWKGRRLVLFGCGKVGTGILYYAHKVGAKTTVVTDLTCLSDSVKGYAEAFIDYRDRSSLLKVLREAYAVVTATGVRNALIDIPADVWNESGALLANMGVEDEWGPQVAPQRVLNGKHTLNFILEEPTQLRYIDATMALHNTGALYLKEQHLPEQYRFILPPVELEEEILSVTRRNGLLGDDLNFIG